MVHPASKTAIRMAIMKYYYESIKNKHMKKLKFIIPILLATFMFACGSQPETKTPTPAPTVDQPDKKVKVKFDGKNKELEIETDKVDIELD